MAPLHSALPRVLPRTREPRDSTEEDGPPPRGTLSGRRVNAVDYARLGLEASSNPLLPPGVSSTAPLKGASSLLVPRTDAGLDLPAVISLNLSKAQPAVYGLNPLVMHAPERTEAAYALLPDWNMPIVTSLNLPTPQAAVAAIDNPLNMHPPGHAHAVAGATVVKYDHLHPPSVLRASRVRIPEPDLVLDWHAELARFMKCARKRVSLPTDMANGAARAPIEMHTINPSKRINLRHLVPPS